MTHRLYDSAHAVHSTSYGAWCERVSSATRSGYVDDHLLRSRTTIVLSRCRRLDIGAGCTSEVLGVYHPGHGSCMQLVYRVIEMSSRGVNRSASRLRLRVGIICQGAQHIDTNNLFLLSPPRSKWNYVEREADSIRYPRIRSWYDHWFQWLVNDAMMYRGASPGPTDDPNKLVHFLSLFIWSREQVKMSRVESAASEW